MTTRPLALLASLALTHVVVADLEIISSAGDLLDLSYDGSVIAYRVSDPDNPCFLAQMRWRDGVGFETLALPPVCVTRYDMSPDGAYLVGVYNAVQPGAIVLWDDQGDVTELPIGGADYIANVGDVTDDGLVVGSLGFGFGFESSVPAVQWPLGGGPEVIGPCAVAFGVSGDGGVTAGYKLGTGKCQESENITRPTVFHAGGEAMLDIDGMYYTDFGEMVGLVPIDGSFARFNIRNFGLLKTAIWTPAEGWELTDDPWVTSISDDGRIATLQAGTGNNFEISIDGEVMNFNDYLVAQGVDLPSGWTLVPGSANKTPLVSGDGRVIAGVATSDDFSHSLFRYVIPEPDTDGDGLLDSWETVGIPYTDSNGVVQHYVLDFDGDGQSDAHPLRRDLFIEIDQGLDDPGFPGDELSDVSVGAVIAAFANAPVSNPDNTTGIDLHLLYDDVLENLPFEWQTGSDNWPDDFDTWRGNWFGTSAERRASPDREAKLEAKAKGVRYCIGADYLSSSVGTALGVARDTPTAEFIVARAAHSDPEEVAATFMHEFGHALGLGHGGRSNNGAESQNWKPNYISVMNYYHSRKFAGTDETWRLDFSSVGLPTIIEDDLYESEGIVVEQALLVPGARTFLTRWPTTDCFPDDLLSVEIEDFPFNTPIDFNRDGMIDPDPDESRAADLDYHGPGAPSFFNTTPSPCLYMLAELADWDVLVYAVPHAGQAAGSAPPNPPVELTVEEIAILDTLIPAPCHGDTNGDDFVNTTDLLNVLGGWGGTGYDPADVTFNGVIDVADLLRILGNWGPCD